jgi:hypothetical protein
MGGGIVTASLGPLLVLPVTVSGVATDMLLRRSLPVAAGLVVVLVLLTQLRRATAAVDQAGARAYGWGRRLALSTVSAGFVAVLVTLAMFSFSGRPARALPSRQPPLAQSIPSPALPQPPTQQGTSSGSNKILVPDPRAVTLLVTDLPSGYHVRKAGPATFSAGGQPLPSWDVVFEPDSNQHADFQMAESLVALYPTTAAATQALDSQVASEQASQAQQYVPLGKLGDRVTVWVEPPSGGGQTEIVRVTWQSLNVLSEVSILGPAGSLQPGRAVQLASVQEERLRMRSPTLETLPSPQA